MRGRHSTLTISMTPQTREQLLSDKKLLRVSLPALGQCSC